MTSATSAVPVGPVDDLRGIISHRQVVTIISGLLVGNFLAAIDATVVSTAVPRIVSELGGLDQITWVFVAYALVATAVTPLYGKLADLLGRRALMLFAVSAFIAGSVLCALAQSVVQLALARGVQGIGGGGLISMPFIILGDIVTPRQRGRYMGYFTGTFALAGVSGPLMGGFFADHLSWRWIFWINVPLGFAALAVIAVVMRYPFAAREHRIDWVGAGILVGAIVSVVLATSWATREYGALARETVALYGASAILGIGFVLWERRVSEPVLPLRLFGNDVIRITCAVAFLSSAAILAVNVYLPTFLQVVTGVSATNSGLRVAPMMIGVLVSSIYTGRSTTRTGRYKHWFVGGASLMVACIAFFTQLAPSTQPETVMVVMFLFGFSMGMFTPILNLAAQNAVDFADLGTATSTVSFARSVGSAIGIAVSGAVLTSRLAHNLEAVIATNPLPAGVTAETLADSPDVIARLAEPLHSAVVEALAGAMGHMYLVLLPVIALAAVLATRLREVPLRGGPSDGHGSRCRLEPETTDDQSRVIGE